MIYHALNRANGRMKIFEKAADYEAFEVGMAEGRDRNAKRLEQERFLMPFVRSKLG